MWGRPIAARVAWERVASRREANLLRPFLQRVRQLLADSAIEPDDRGGCFVGRTCRQTDHDRRRYPALQPRRSQTGAGRDHACQRGFARHWRRTLSEVAAVFSTVATPTARRAPRMAAAKDWLAAAGITEGPVFRPIGKGGRLCARRLAPQSVALIVKSYAALPEARSGRLFRA